MDDVTLIPVNPGVGEIRRYEVFEGIKPKGFVFQWLSRLDLSKETSRIRIDGKRRPFWSFIGKNGRPNYSIKLETRKEALRWLASETEGE